MGFEVSSFPGEVDVELICLNCLGVPEDPLQVGGCEHAFCHLCVQERLLQEPTRPIDRQMITPTQLQPVPRILRHLLSKLNITCRRGCKAAV